MATDTTVINSRGKTTGWNNITVNLLARDLQGITEISYSDETKKENVYGAGPYPVGRSEGNYQAKASITLQKQEVDALLANLPKGSRLQDIKAFDITVEYADEKRKIIKDCIRNCEFTGNAIESKSNEGVIENKFELLVSHIEWNIN